MKVEVSDEEETWEGSEEAAAVITKLRREVERLSAVARTASGVAAEVNGFNFCSFNVDSMPTGAPPNSSVLCRPIVSLIVLPDEDSLTTLESSCIGPIAKYPKIDWPYGTASWTKSMKGSCVIC